MKLFAPLTAIALTLTVAGFAQAESTATRGAHAARVAHVQNNNGQGVYALTGQANRLPDIATINRNDQVIQGGRASR